MSPTEHRRPRYIGEVVVFRNPHRRSTFLVDIAVRDPKLGLYWAALALDDPKAIAAIKAFRGNVTATALPGRSYRGSIRADLINKP